MIQRKKIFQKDYLYPIHSKTIQLAQAKGFFKENGSTRPVTPAKGVMEKDFQEGSKNILGTPARKFSTATPSSELANAKTQMNYLQSLNRRFAESRASSKARETAKKSEKERRKEEANKNMKLASQFLDYAHRVQKGQNPEPVNVTVDVNTKPTLPKVLTKEQKIASAQAAVAEGKKEEKIINKVVNPEKPAPPSSPAMAQTTVSTSEPQVVQQTQQTQKPQQKPKPVQKTDLSLSEEALLRFPAKG